MLFGKVELNVRIIFGLYRDEHIFIFAVKNRVGSNVIIRHVENINKIPRKQVIIKHTIFIEGIDKNICKGRRGHADIRSLIK